LDADIKMGGLLFFSLAKHQARYFQQLLEQPGLRGTLVECDKLPGPALFDIAKVISRVPLSDIVEAKCQERRVKKKYQGLIYRLLLRLELIFTALRLQTVLKRTQPSGVVVWNGSARHCALLLALVDPACKRFFIENGLMPNTTTLDTQGVNYNNSMPRNADFYLSYGAAQGDLSASPPARLVPRKPRVADLQPIQLPDRFVFIPFQDDRDTQVRLFSPWIKNMRELFALGERLASEAGLTVVFKEHPSSRESYPELHERCHERLLFANGNSTQELIERSDFIVTLNSTVGLESLLLGKPLLTLGNAFFNIEGLVMHAKSADELVRVASAFPNWPLNEALRLSFLHYLQHQYCVPGSWSEATPEHLQEAARRIRQGLQS
jgi:capsular polysaccharide export protein